MCFFLGDPGSLRFSAWLLPLLVTIFVDDNCLSGWKWTWTVCKAASPEHKKFDWKIYDEETLGSTTEHSEHTDLSLHLPKRNTKLPGFEVCVLCPGRCFEQIQGS